ncbi:hypothetical protein [Bradyrhizobium genosp. P]|uniref:hypothetical protein n=1 Tax=Bradyrhizobium genosp. P TaxID=83641 RepID=UPI003CF55801
MALLNIRKCWDALEPYAGQWVFHYPIFLNTYCLAFHLGRFLIHHHKDRQHVSNALLRQEHWAATDEVAEGALVASFGEGSRSNCSLPAKI